MFMKRKQLTGWLLSVLILFGQSVALAHEADHELKFTDEYCVQCLTQSVFENKAVIPVSVLANLSFTREIWAPVEDRCHVRYSRTNTARSPPISLITFQTG